jgi:hypothetical protein
MNICRRDFLKTSLAVSAAAAFSARGEAATTSSSSPRECYELREYKLKSPEAKVALDAYLEQGVLPALAKRGIQNVGVFTEIDVDKAAATFTPKTDSPVWVLIPHASLDSFVGVSAELNTDADVQKAGGGYLKAPKADAAIHRINSWLYLAFKSMPKMEVAAFSKSKVPTRVFEMRDYESHSELAALNKMAMFDNGETELMRDLGMSPLFFGQGIAGANLPHLRYITSGPDLAAHLGGWKKFGPDPRWKKLSGDPQYANNTSKISGVFLTPTAYSQI